MNKKAIFQQLMADFISKPLKDIVSREFIIPLDIPKVVSILGPRRAGKTCVLFDLILRLRDTIPAYRIVYINLEDDRLFPLRLEDLDDLVTGYYEMYPNAKDEKVWFFLDEVQVVDQWEKFIRRLSDQENCRIYITGSSSKLLSRELASSLRGRSLPFEVFPLSFREFMKFNKIDADPYSSKGKALLAHWLRKYLLQGGFPELVFLPEAFHRRTINEYIDLMLFRDLTERFSLKNPALLKYLLKYTLANVANPMSVTKIFHDLKSQGYAVGKNTVFEYISYLEEAFALFRVEIFSKSKRVQAVNPGKIYTVDPAFKHAMSIGEDLGRVFENVVFMELRRRGIFPAYLLGDQEVDFFWLGGLLMNVCFDTSEESTYRREISGLQQAMGNQRKKESWLITANQKSEVIQDGNTIHIIPYWEFINQDLPRS